MEDNMYSGMGGDTSAGSDTPAQPSPDEGEGKEKDMGGETALIPKSLLAGKDFQVGEEVVLKIVHDHGDEVEVEYASEKPDEKGAGEMGPPEMASADAQLGQMAQ